MSSMKQLAGHVLRGEGADRIHVMTRASFPDAGRTLGGSWRQQARKPSKGPRTLGARAGGALDAVSPERWPDLTICRDFGFGTIRAVLRRRLAPQCRVLLCLDHMPPSVRLAHRVVLAGADAVLVHSDAMARAVHALGVPAPRIVLSGSRNDGASLDCPARPRASDGFRQVVHVGDLEPEAGVADFLLCVTAWAERNPQRRVGLRWCGEGCLRGVLEAQPLPPNVQQSFPGRAAREDLAAVFADCDLLALPALADPWDDVVLEALAAQLPVLGSTQSRTVGDLVSHGVTGWVFNPFESGAMARAVEQALNAAPDELDRMRACAAGRSKQPMPSLNERIWRAMRLEGAGPDFNLASLGTA